jgi:hypothetical protein
VIPNPAERPWLSVDEAGAFLGLGHTKSYTEARRFIETDGAEGLPVIRFGRTFRVPTAKLLELLGLDSVAVRPSSAGRLVPIEGGAKSRRQTR